MGKTYEYCAEVCPSIERMNELGGQGWRYIREDLFVDMGKQREAREDSARLSISIAVMPVPRLFFMREKGKTDG